MNKTQLKQVIKSTFSVCNPQKIILFRSHARQQADSSSDVDLIIVLKTNKRFLDRMAELYMLWKTPIAIDILAYTPEEFARFVSEENPLIMSALNEGEVIYEKRAV